MIGIDILSRAALADLFIVAVMIVAMFIGSLVISQGVTALICRGRGE